MPLAVKVILFVIIKRQLGEYDEGELCKRYLQKLITSP